MLFPTIGFLIGMIGFRTIRLIVLSLSGRPRVVPLLVFVASAFVVALAWSFVFAHVFGDTSGSLKNPAARKRFRGGALSVSLQESVYRASAVAVAVVHVSPGRRAVSRGALIVFFRSCRGCADCREDKSARRRRNLQRA